MKVANSRQHNHITTLARDNSQISLSSQLWLCHCGFTSLRLRLRLKVGAHEKTIAKRAVSVRRPQSLHANLINFKQNFFALYWRKKTRQAQLKWPRNVLKKRERRNKIKILKKKQRKPQSERVGARKNILWSTQLRNSKCLTFVFYFYQLETGERNENIFIWIYLNETR